MSLADNQRQWVLDVAPNRLQKLRAGGAIDHAMIAAHRDSHTLTNLELSIDHDGHFLDAADGEDSCLWRIDDRSKLIDAEHAEVGDRESGTSVLLGSEFALAGFL